MVCTLPQLFIILKAEATYVQRCPTQKKPVRNKMVYVCVCVCLISLGRECQILYNLEKHEESLEVSTQHDWICSEPWNLLALRNWNCRGSKHEPPLANFRTEEIEWLPLSGLTITVPMCSMVFNSERQSQ